MQKALSEDNFGVRPGTKTKLYKMTPEEEEAELKAWEEEDAKEGSRRGSRTEVFREKVFVFVSQSS